MNEIDFVLRRQLADVDRQVRYVQEQVGGLVGKVDAVGAAQHRAHGELRQLRDDFLAFVRQFELSSNVQRAETRIGVIQDEMDHRFGHHRTVRRTAVGMLQAFDLGVVSEETVRAVSEQLMIQTPRYWLAPALVALASWAADDPGLCDRAVEEAFRRSPGRTSLFFALVLRRQGRLDPAARWLRHHLLAQDPAALGREFTVILESVAQGAFGPASRAVLADTMTVWHERLEADPGARTAQVRRWRAALDALPTPAGGGEFPRLAAVSPQWPQLGAALGAARAQRTVLDTYRAVMTGEPTSHPRLLDAIDDILDRLVGEYDAEELPLRRDLALQRAVVEHDGDVDAARQAVAVNAAGLEPAMDLLSLQSTAALTPAAIGASPATRRLAVAACREWFTEAHAGFGRDYRMAQPSDVQVVLGTAPGPAPAGPRIPPWTGSLNTPQAELEQSLGRHWDEHTRPLVQSLVFPLRRHLLLLGGVLLAIVLLLGGADAARAAGLATVVGGIWGVLLYVRHRRSATALAAARKALAHSREEAFRDLRAAAAELTDWQSAFRAADAVEAEVRAMLADLATAGHARNPYDGRSVRPDASGSSHPPRGGTR
ncbi:hypothetical protein [Kitasatospora sp. NPDC087315]|uniref:hypothetical protein n=1 Tax=Kitasatospora sp. NPDC087315 TaxID=3364069 RepID=UPI0037F68C8C